MIESLSTFASQFADILPEVAARLVGAWLATIFVLAFTLRGLKRYVRSHILRFDKHVRDWAFRIRYRDQTDKTSENAARSWFFRFWTNFASAPSLSFFSLALPFWASTNQPLPRLFFLPGLCYAGSLLLSFVAKRVFPRARPMRGEGDFGHKLRDSSFPSGHSLTSFCFWTMLVITTLAAGLTISWIIPFAVVAAFVVGFTGFSRVYLGVHFPSDVLGGFIIGFIWCVVCFFALLPVLHPAF